MMKFLSYRIDSILLNEIQSLEYFLYERGETLDLLDIDISAIFVLRKEEEESRNIFSFSFCERLFIIPILLQKKPFNRGRKN